MVIEILQPSLKPSCAKALARACVPYPRWLDPWSHPGAWRRRFFLPILGKFTGRDGALALKFIRIETTNLGI